MLNGGPQVAEDTLEAAVADLAVRSRGRFLEAPAPPPSGPARVQEAQVAEDMPSKRRSPDLAVEGERLLEVRPRLLRPALLAVQAAQVAEDEALVAAVAKLAVDGERLPVVRSASSIRPCSCAGSQVAEDDALAAAVADLAVDGERLLVVLARLLHPALLRCRMPRLPRTIPSLRRSPTSRMMASARS